MRHTSSNPSSKLTPYGRVSTQHAQPPQRVPTSASAPTAALRTNKTLRSDMKPKDMSQPAEQLELNNPACKRCSGRGEACTRKIGTKQKSCTQCTRNHDGCSLTGTTGKRKASDVKSSADELAPGDKTKPTLRRVRYVDVESEDETSGVEFVGTGQTPKGASITNAKPSRTRTDEDDAGNRGSSASATKTAAKLVSTPSTPRKLKPARKQEHTGPPGVRALQAAGTGASAGLQLSDTPGKGPRNTSRAEDGTARSAVRLEGLHGAREDFFERLKGMMAEEHDAAIARAFDELYMLATAWCGYEDLALLA